MPKKKKGKGVVSEAKLDLQEKLARANARCSALERELGLRSEQARKAEDERDRMKELLKVYQDVSQESTDARKDVTSDMTRQYKSMQGELFRRIERLERELASVKDQRDLAVLTVEETKAEKDRISMEKDELVVDLKRKMDEQALQFGSK